MGSCGGAHIVWGSRGGGACQREGLAGGWEALACCVLAGGRKQPGVARISGGVMWEDGKLLG